MPNLELTGWSKLLESGYAGQYLQVFAALLRFPEIVFTLHIHPQVRTVSCQLANFQAQKGRERFASMQNIAHILAGYPQRLRRFRGSIPFRYHAGGDCADNQNDAKSCCYPHLDFRFPHLLRRRLYATLQAGSGQAAVSRTTSK